MCVRYIYAHTSCAQQSNVTQLVCGNSMNPREEFVVEKEKTHLENEKTHLVSRKVRVHESERDVREEVSKIWRPCIQNSSKPNQTLCTRSSLLPRLRVLRGAPRVTNNRLQTRVMAARSKTPQGEHGSWRNGLDSVIQQDRNGRYSSSA